MADVHPPDPDTAVGQFRFLIGDTDFDADKGTYARFTDGSITSYLEMGAGNTNRAIGYAYLALSSQAAEKSKSIKDYDLQIDLTRRAKDLRDTAAMWFGLADADDEIGGGSDIFELADIGQRHHLHRAEGAQWPYPYGR